MKIFKLENLFKSIGYYARRPELLAICSILGRKNDSIRAILLEGLPGTGKSSLAEATAKVLGSEFIFSLLHSWSDDQELFSGIDVAAAVAGESENVRQHGVLARAAELSKTASPDRPVVVCLDEIDKVQERTEYLLLDFLQTGRVPVKPGVHLQGVVENMIVFLTSNGSRPLSDPLLRRVRRVHLDPLKAEVIDEILQKKTGLPSGLIKVARKAAYAACENKGKIPALQVLENLVLELVDVAESIEDVCYIFEGWVDVSPNKNLVSPVWAEICKLRRGIDDNKKMVECDST